MKLIKLAIALVLVAMLAASAACSQHSSPTAPSTCNTPGAINIGATGDCKFPNPASGTTVQTFPLPGTDQPLYVWITGISPAKDSQLAPGQSASVRWQCAGPGGYSFWISNHFVKAGQPSNDKDSSSGASFNLPNDCGGAFVTNLPPGTTGDIASFQLLVWLSEKGKTIVVPYPADRPADFTREEPLGWKMLK